MASQHNVLQKIAAAARWSYFVTLSAVVALGLAWALLAHLQFLYPLWYEVIAIDDNIAVYGPQNRNRRYFEITTKAEHRRLFGALVDAIHGDAEGLPDLVYHNPLGRPLATFLTAPEIAHLRDVAWLVTLGQRIAWSAFALWLALLAWLVWRQHIPPPTARVFMGLSAALVVVAVIVLAIGPVQVFYQLHTVVFPSERPWFFYYQDSLMTTMLKAPDIFAYIAGVWLALSLLLLSGILAGVRRFLVYKTRSSA